MRYGSSTLPHSFPPADPVLPTGPSLTTGGMMLNIDVEVKYDEAENQRRPPADRGAFPFARGDDPDAAALRADGAHRPAAADGGEDPLLHEGRHPADQVRPEVEGAGAVAPADAGAGGDLPGDEDARHDHAAPDRVARLPHGRDPPADREAVVPPAGPGGVTAGAAPAPAAPPATPGELFASPSANASTIFPFSTFLYTKFIRMSFSPGSATSCAVVVTFLSVRSEERRGGE